MKAEFDSLKSTFQAQIDRYNSSIDNKIDGAIAGYLEGVKVNRATSLKNLISEAKSNNQYATTFINDWDKNIVTTNDNCFRAAYSLIFVSTANGAVATDANDSTWSGKGNYVNSNDKNRNYDTRLILSEYLYRGQTYYYVDNNDTCKVTQSIWHVACAYSSGSWSPNWDYSGAKKNNTMREAGAYNQTYVVGGVSLTIPCYHTAEQVMSNLTDTNILYVPSLPANKINYGVVGDKISIFDGDWIEEKHCSFDGNGGQYAGYWKGTYYNRSYYFSFYQNKVLSKKPQEWLNYGASIALGRPVLNGNGIPVATLSDKGNVKFIVNVAESGTLAVSKNEFDKDWNWTENSDNVLYNSSVVSGNTTIELESENLDKDDTIFLKFKPDGNNAVEVSVVNDIVLTIVD